MKASLNVFIAALLSVGWMSIAQAQSSLDQYRQQVNQGTVGIIAGGADSAFTELAGDIGVALENQADTRVLTILGRGSFKNIEDLLFLKGIDIALTQSDVLEFFEELKLIPGIKSQVSFITKFNQEEFHLLTRVGIKDIRELEGKKVNFGRNGTGTFTTSSVVFDQLGISVQAETYPHKKALELLKAGEIDAMAKVDGKPVDVIASASLDNGLHLIPLPVDALADVYETATIGAQDYPNLFPPDDEIETVAVSSVMAAYNWPEDHPRRAKVDLFIKRFADVLPELQDPSNGYHEKWSGITLDQDVVGWRRHDAVAEVLDEVTQASAD